MGDTVADQTLYAIASIKSACELIIFRITDVLGIGNLSGERRIRRNNGARFLLESDQARQMLILWLHFREQNALMRRDDTVYTLYEAKKFSEISPSVGKKTYIDVIDHHGKKITTLGEAEMNELEKTIQAVRSKANQREGIRSKISKRVCLARGVRRLLADRRVRFFICQNQSLKRDGVFPC